MRTDFNTPLQGQKIKDPLRVDRAFPSIQHVLSGGGRLVIGSHLGRPRRKHGGLFKEDQKRFSLSPAASYLNEKYGLEVLFMEDPDPPAIALRLLLNGLKENQVLLLENLRFHSGEVNEDLKFTERFAAAVDIYINECFSSSHRRSATITALPPLVPERAAGFLFQQEASKLQKLLKAEKRPFYTILGGSKVKDKIPLLQSLLPQADGFLVGGAAALVFLKAKGESVGGSFVEKGLLSQAEEFMDRAEALKKKLFLPVDHIVTKNLKTAESVKSAAFVPKGFQAADIGPQTVRLFIREMKKSGTLFWNGPMGFLETPLFRQGTEALAAALSQQTETYRVAGGGHTALALKGFEDKIDYISTGGGAALQYLQKGSLPGMQALEA